MKIRYIFSDFDGTLTSNGEISKVFIDILKNLEQKKITFVVVSGRSASWGHFFLTHFPISYAVMESGGVILSKKDSHIKMHVLAKPQQLDQLEKVKKLLHKKMPSLSFAVDNVGRITDRAIELNSLKDKEIYKSVQNFLNKHRCHYSVSNIHLNFSSIPNDKWTGTCYLVEQVLKKEMMTIQKKACFFGDAPNDEVMFKNFQYSVGVGNIVPYLKTMKHPPRKVTKAKEVEGVLEFLKDAAIL